MEANRLEVKEMEQNLLTKKKLKEKSLNVLQYVQAHIKTNHLKITTLSLKSTEYLTDSRTW